MTGFTTECNFKFPDDSQNVKMRELFNDLDNQSESLAADLKSGLIAIFPDNIDEIDNLLALGKSGEEIVDGMLGVVEHVDINKDHKVTITFLADYNYEGTVAKFMKFILAVGGKPLVSKVWTDESIVSYTMSKKGNITESVRDNDEY